ncbi:MAG: hypothetical protein ABIP51_13385, partial [Bacteroidia bacterium]
MKKTIKKIALVALLALSINSFSQTKAKKQSLTILNIDVHGLDYYSTVMGSLVRTEVEKLDSFSVTDKYDINYILEKNRFASVAYEDTSKIKNRYKIVRISGNKNALFTQKDTIEIIDKYNGAFVAERNKEFVNNCFGKLCLVEIGETIHSDKMLSGSVERFGKTIVVTLRLIDVNSKSIEKTYVKEFLNLPEEMQGIIHIAVRDMFGQSNDKNLVAKLTERFEFDNAINNPHQERLRLDGPRLGCVFYTGETQARLMEGKESGGFDAVPVMFQFGYQFEKQYLNEGKLQALFEFIPTITGIDQGYFIPSLTILNGLRSNVNGWEFALGPTMNLITTSNGYYDQDNKWQLESNWKKDPKHENVANPFEIKQRIDSRGDYMLNTGFVLAVGR